MTKLAPSLILLLALPGCGALSFVATDAELYEVERGLRAELQEQGVAVADAAPPPEESVVTTAGGGIGWLELLLATAGGVLLRGIPSKGPLLALGRAARALVAPEKGQPKNTAA